MNNKTFGVILLVALLIGVAAAVIYEKWYLPQTVTVGTAALEIYLTETKYENGTDIEWGLVEPGKSYNKSLNVTNTGTLPCNVTLILIDLPIGWTETWTANKTIIATGEWANGTLTLTVPSDALGYYQWNSYIRGEQT